MRFLVMTVTISLMQTLGTDRSGSDAEWFLAQIVDSGGWLQAEHPFISCCAVVTG
jgi:hypothetical protein